MKIEIDEECRSCSGTGLYIGIAERDGAAIVCSQCGGSGCFHFVHEYAEFIGRLAHTKKIKRVYQVNPGVVIGEGGGLKLEDFGGMPASDWTKGDPFLIGSEDRNHTCPRWWYQSADYKIMPQWEECFQSLGVSFSRCSYFQTKGQCWKRWDDEATYWGRR
jgi:hypothetical protein